MSTIEKCSDIALELGEVFEQIKVQDIQTNEKQKSSNTITQQHRKNILKLFNYDKWQGYMKWIDEKLEESGEGLDSLLEASELESIQPTETHNLQEESDVLTTKKQSKYNDYSFETESAENEIKLLQKQNKKLKNMNVGLNKKYQDLKRAYTKIMK